MTTIEKAIMLINEGKVKIVENSTKNVWFEVEGNDSQPYSVKFKDNVFECSCMFSTNNFKNKKLCSHAISCIMVLGIEKLWENFKEKMKNKIDECDYRG